MKVICTEWEKSKLLDILCNSFADCMFNVYVNEYHEPECNDDCADCYESLIEWEIVE